MQLMMCRDSEGIMNIRRYSGVVAASSRKGGFYMLR